MTATAFPCLFGPVLGPIDFEITASRKLLLALPGFLHFFENVSHPSALLSTNGKLVLANGHLTRMLGLQSDTHLVGRALGDLPPGPVSADHQASTQYLEIQGKGFLVLTMGGGKHPTINSRFVGP